MKKKNTYSLKGTAGVSSTDDPDDFDGDENKERGNWSGQLDFILSCVGFAVGLGNVWRFPYLCYKHGGGAFLIPYAVCLALAGLPLFFFELALGQYASLGCIPIWKLAPMFRGIGYAMITISALVCIYYNIIITYTVYYLFASMTSELPWSSCNNTWNTDTCVAKREENQTFDFTPTAPADEYWKNSVLELTDGIDDLGGLRWQLVLCLGISWIVVFLCLIKGIKSTGKVVYFTALFPYVVLTCLLIRGLTLDGAYEGIKFYIVPDWDRLSDAKVWGDAAVQIFYSLGPGWGSLITFASYNRFHNNCYRDAIIVAVINCGTSVFAGFVIFSCIGFMAHELHVDVSNVTDSGPGLAFVAYPEGLARMPVAPLWAIIFFFMLFTLGLDSMFGMMEAVLSGLSDEFPNVLRKNKIKFTLVCCVIGFLLGLPMCTRGGFYLMHLMDWYSAGYPLFIVALFEILAVIYLYGYRRFSENIKLMLGFKPNVYWIATWHVLTPLMILGIIGFTSWQYTRIYLGAYVYPKWGETLGWLMVAASIMWIPIWILIVFIQHARENGFKSSFVNFGQTWRALTSPTDDWGPALSKYREMDTTINDKLHDTNGTELGPPPPYVYTNAAVVDNKMETSQPHPDTIL